MPRRSKKVKLSSSRDSKVERLKNAIVLLQSKGYFTREDIGVASRVVFEWYCMLSGGVVARVGGTTVCRSPSIGK